MELGYLTELLAYWRDEYDWRRAEARLNAFDHFLTEIDSTRVHFLHARSPEPDALPLIVTHGWPGSIVEFLDIIGPLSDPRAHGGDPQDAFHVVCPSIPGYAFSGPTHERGWNSGRVANAFVELMAGLGYSRYGAQGGDWGGMISTQIGLADPEHVAGVHLNLAIAFPPADLDMSTLSDAERDSLASLDHYQRDENGYARIQGTRPQTIGYALDDSPAGLAAWIVEKFRAWTDCGGDVERCLTKDVMLDNIMLYWLTGTAHSAGRLYYEIEHGGSGRAERACRSAGRGGGVSQRGDALSALVGGASIQRRPVDRHAAGRPLRRARATRATRRRRPQLLPDGALNAARVDLLRRSPPRSPSPTGGRSRLIGRSSSTCASRRPRWRSSSPRSRSIPCTPTHESGSVSRSSSACRATCSSCCRATRSFPVSRPSSSRSCASPLASHCTSRRAAGSRSASCWSS